ncbi:helix-turn-helix domain-containing protein [Kibdelosporangium aridum]|uniref:Zn-dependent peptidase ImmA, M78 family n=1 Tax=Kibdelosporangium aridum TaxID=2030 RepID=A0A1Y5XSH7_KIBAR|nr:ImmA/IrrE family metallo-endopeptidase [Kibdelosporangium aridum]SMD14729.1 Zn-dependent peptidase ImmA, M78 family [Kibdelosporangium aridum]
MFVPSRLTAARKRRGTSIAALSTSSGISKASISAYENDKKVPSQQTLNQLAHTLRVPAAYFSRPPLDEVPLPAVSFRAPSKMTARSRDTALQLASHATELRQWIDAHYEVPSVDVPTLHKYVGTSAAAEAAAVVRAKWGLGEAPLGNLIHLLELHGIAVFSAKADDGVFDAFSFRAEDRPYVLLNTAKSAERSRFDAAHELGHLVLHSEATTPTGVDAEREADAFASAFLMPEADVRAHFSTNPPLDQILLKKRRWRVSAIALAYRLHDLGLLSEWLYHTTCVNLSRLGYRSGEPDGIERESSRLLNQVMTDLWSRRRGFEQLCQELAVESHDINDLVFNLAPVAISGDRHQSPPVRPSLQVVT